MFNLPLRIWLSIAAVAVIGAALVGLVLHERHVGADKVTAADARVAAAQTIHNIEVETRAKVLADQAVAKLKTSLAAPPAADAPHLVCRTAPSARAMRADGVARPAADAAAFVPAEMASVGEPDPIDFGPEIDKLFSDADATVTALQSYIQACIDQGFCKALAK